MFFLGGHLVCVCVCYTHFHQQNLNVPMYAYVTSLVLLLMIEYPPLSSVDESYEISHKFKGQIHLWKCQGVTVGLVWTWDTPAAAPQNPMVYHHGFLWNGRLIGHFTMFSHTLFLTNLALN